MHFVSALFLVVLFLILALALWRAAWRIANFVSVVVIVALVVLCVGMATEPYHTQLAFQNVVEQVDHILINIWQAVQDALSNS